MNWLLIVLCSLLLLRIFYWLCLIARRDIQDLVSGVNRRRPEKEVIK